MKTKGSLFRKILVFFLALAFLPLFVTTYFSYLQVRESSFAVFAQGTSNLLNEIEVVLEKEIALAVKHIKLLSESQVMVSEDASLEMKTQEMRRFYDLFRVLDDVTLLDPDGVTATSLKYDFKGDWRYKAWFKEALSGKVGISPVHVITNPTRFVIVITAPVFGSDGKVRAVLAGRIGMERIWDIVDKIKVGRTGFVVITDAKGKIVSFPDKERILSGITPEALKTRLVAGGEGAFEFAGEGNAGKLCFYSGLKAVDEYGKLQWRISVIQDKDEVYAMAHKMMRQLWVIVLVCVLMVGILSFVLSSNIVRPIRSLVRASEKVSDGNFDEGVEVTSDDEIGELGKAFNKMVAGLKGSTVSIKLLEKEQKRFRDVAERAGEWIWEVDPQGRYTYSSPVVERILGYTSEELVGKKYFYDFFRQDEKEKLKKDALEIFASKVSFDNFENVNVRKDGREVILETSALPVVDADGNLTGYRGVDRDVTERKRLAEEAKERMHELEVFNKACFGREARIIELKKEVETLKKALGQ